ncbi:MAG: chemotaxis response regulator protein-glutamate methylesterase [Actinomycetota bacterium]
MRIAIVNDMLLAVEALRRVVVSVPDYQIAWIARDGADAVAKCAQDLPDLILMDLIMPVMDGVEASRQIMLNSPCAILVVTSTVSGNASKVFEAMGYGALDAVNTPIVGSRGTAEGGAEMLAKIATIAKLIGKSAPTPATKLKPYSSKVPPLIAIGSSTGGPKALAAVLSQFPANFPAAIAIVQHVDLQFASGLVDWLNEQTPLTVELASLESQLTVGKVLLAGTNDHLILQSNLTLKYTKEPRDNPYRPSVDVFFKSLVKHWPGKGVGVVLTGMGRDGAEGLKDLQSKGWHTIAQDRSTCVVYGMPKAAAELGAAEDILPLDAIAPAIMKSRTLL